MEIKMQSVKICRKKLYEKENQALFQAVKDFQNGDKQAFEQVYKLSEKYVYSIIYRIIQDNDKTADLMQETYLQVYNKLFTLENVETFLVWAGRIATNKTLRFIQKDSKEVLLSEEDNDFIFEKASDDKEEFLPEGIMLNKEKKKKIYDIIYNLSNEQKITVQYYYLEEMSVSEIAEVMQCPAGTVKSRLNYARKQIKQEALDTEKREGIKIYSLSGLPLFWLLFREEVASCTVPKAISSSVIKGVAESAGLKAIGTAGIETAKAGKKGIKEFIHKFLKSTGGKVVSGVAVATVGGVVAFTQVPKTLYTTPNDIIGCQYRYEDTQHPEDCDNQYLIDGKYLVFENDEGQSGVYTINGKEVLPLGFDEIDYNDYTGGLFKVRKNDKLAYYDKSGRIVCDGIYDDVGYVTDGMFWCYDKKSNKYKIYSVDGKPVSNYSFDYIGEMTNGMVVVKNDSKCGLLRKDGNLILELKYDDIYLGDGKYIALNESITGGYRRTVLDYSLNIVFTEDYDNEYLPLCFSSGFYNGVAELSGFENLFTPVELPVTVDGTWIFNPMKTDYLSHDFHLYQNGYFSYYNDKLEKSVLFNTDGKEIATASYLGITYINDKFIIKDGNKYSLIDGEGNAIISGYDNIQSRYKGNYFICSDDNRYDLYNNSGSILYNDAIDISSIGCEMFQCCSENETFIVNGQDEKYFVLSPEEQIASNYSDGYSVKLTETQELLEGQPIFTYEVIDKSGKTEYTIKAPKDSSIDNIIVLKQGLYSYRSEDKCYIKTW